MIAAIAGEPLPVLQEPFKTPFAEGPVQLIEYFPVPTQDQYRYALGIPFEALCVDAHIYRCERQPASEGRSQQPVERAIAQRTMVGPHEFEGERAQRFDTFPILSRQGYGR